MNEQDELDTQAQRAGFVEPPWDQVAAGAGWSAFRHNPWPDDPDDDNLDFHIVLGDSTVWVCTIYTVANLSRLIRRDLEQEGYPFWVNEDPSYMVVVRMDRDHVAAAIDAAVRDQTMKKH